MSLPQPSEPHLAWTPPPFDAKIFVPCGCEKRYLVGTAWPNGFYEAWAQVAAKVSAKVAHHGPDPFGHLRYTTRFEYVYRLRPDQLALRWGKCRFISGLRLGVGFPSCVLEGLACGARPVVFDTPENRYYLGGSAIYVARESERELIDDLVTIARAPIDKVSAAEREWVVEQFGRRP